MHEMSVVAGLFDLLEENARNEKAAKITSVTLRVGRLSGVVPDLLETAFETYKKGTSAETAVLRIELVPLKIRCRACDAETLAEEPVFVCSACGASDFEILEGRDLVLERMEVEIQP